MNDQKHVGDIAKLWLAACISGILGAVAMYLFHSMSNAVEWLFTGQIGSLVQGAKAIPPWARIVVPTSGGILAGLVLQWGEKWAYGPHIDYIDAARDGNVVLNDRTNVVRTISSMFSVGSGASIGREGPMVQLSAWFSSHLARLMPIGQEARNAVLVCGIAAGVASAYHAPVAGVVFVLELALGFFSRHAVAPVLISAVTASSLIFWMIEPMPLYIMPAHAPLTVTPSVLLTALFAGTTSGLIGLGLLKLLERGKSGFGRIRTPWIRLGVGGLIVGMISVPVPDVWGNGYDVVSRVLNGGLAWNWVLAVLIAKVAATVSSNGSGAIGGIFTPTLFVGATTGYLMGTAICYVAGSAAGTDPVMMSIICMTAMLSAVTHAPLMAIVMVIEMTSQFQLVLPVMLASGAAYAVSTQFGAKPLYGNPIEHHA